MKLKIFESMEFGSIRTIFDEDGKILFCGRDAAKALGYQKPQNAIRMHCKRYALKQGIPHPQNPDRKIGMLFISEPDLYRLITHSKLPSADQFESWIFEDVLPSLRQYGAYITPKVLVQMEKSPEFSAQLVRILSQEREKTEAMQKQMSQMMEKVNYFDKLVSTETLTSIRETAKELHIPEKLFTYLLVEMGLAYRTRRRQLMPYAFMVTCGYINLKEYTTGKHGGVYMLFTPVGRLYLYRKISKRLAVKPSIETEQPEQV